MYYHRDEILALETLPIDIRPIDTKPVPAVYPAISEGWDSDSVGWQVVSNNGIHYRVRSGRRLEEE